MILRDYQQAGHDAAVAHLRRSLAPVLIAAATGAGKSFIVAALARSLNRLAKGGFVLCLAPSRELVLQNAAKYEKTGEPFSIYSASAGEKNPAGPVVFCSPITVLNSIVLFAGKVSAVVIDECHGVTPTIKTIVERLRAEYAFLRVVGLTATPYRLGEGYIYRHIGERAYGDSEAREPWFERCVYRIDARTLIERGYLTPPQVGDVGDTYDTSKLELNRLQRFAPDDVERAFVGKGRLTSKIVAEIVAKSKNRHGVLIFAATVAHAHECLASLPPGRSAMVTGATPANERAELLRRFLARELKYLVNVAVLTTGFDAEHVDVIAMLRRTESAGLLQQIVGRGLRACPSKENCLVLDYAGNIETHCPDGDIFDPAISALPASKDRQPVDVRCPACGLINVFRLSPEGEKHGIDEHGYCIDLTGRRLETDWGPLPGHYGRRCLHEGCDYRWTSKTCLKCKTENDISARTCRECAAELVDPNEKLAREHRKFMRDPTQQHTEHVLSMHARKYTSKKGNPTICARFKTEYRTVDLFLPLLSENQWNKRRMALYRSATRNGRIPTSITYRKNPKTGFFDIIAYDREPDQWPGNKAR